jgi:hypothetical protein
MPATSAHGVALLVLWWLLPVAAGSAAPAPVEPRELVEAPPVAWDHRLVWSLSSDDVLFGQIAQAVLLDQGLLAVADRQLGQVLLIDDSGRVLDVLPTAGEGPGKVGHLTGLCAVSGGHLMLVQAWPGRAEIVRLDGTPVRSLAARGRERDGVVSLVQVAAGHGLVVGVIAAVRFLEDERSRNILRLGPLGEDLEPLGDVLRREATTVDRMGVIDETALDFPFHSWCILDGGHVAVAPDRTRYLVEVHDLDGGPPRVFSRDLDPLPRPAVEIERLRAGYMLEVDGRRRSLEVRHFLTAQMIQELVALDPSRLLLVTAYRDRDLRDDASARLDLVDLAAASVGAVEVSISWRPDRDRLVVLPNRDLVVLVAGHVVFGDRERGPAADPVAPAIMYWRYEGERP